MKRFAPLALALLIATGLSACDSSTNNTTAVVPPEASVVDDYIGLSVKDARSNALKNSTSFRVVMENGEPQMVTMDFQPGRINATVEKGLVTSYDIEGDGEIPVDEPAAPQYNADSWKTIIPDTCTSYFDGCNNCFRTTGIEVSACTKKACSEYRKPVCLDDPVDDQPIPTVRSVEYSCDDDVVFTVFYGEYNGQTLDVNEMTLVGKQEHVLTKTPSDGGEQYQSEAGLVFLDNGLNVTITQNGQSIYTGCKAV